ncbi:MAG: hypothetical protein HY926_14945 [Elusimicrobia bacterium]|nr:hypothetical protein [Elusimicrobiota bacterium]
MGPLLPPLAACLLSAALAAGPAVAPVEPAPAALSPVAAQRLESAEAMLQETPSGRLLLAETSGLPRRESDGLAGDALARFVRGPRPALVLGPRRLRGSSDADLALALARELSRAAADLPMAMPEGDMAACQDELEFAVERSGLDDEFARLLRAAYAEAARRDETARAAHRRAAALLPAGEGLDLPPAALPRGELERAGQFLLLFARDPDEFYWSVEKGVPRPADAVRLGELEDFMDRYGPDFGSARLGPSGRYARLGGRRYDPALLRAARRLVESGGAARLREALGPFDTVGADALRVKVNDWVRAAP